jgi:hypothetical protein
VKTAEACTDRSAIAIAGKTVAVLKREAVWR